MLDLPEMVQGAIHQDYRETMQSARLLDGPRGDYPKKEEQPTINGPGCSTDPTACASGSDSPCQSCDCEKEEKLAMPPFVAGWSTPPPLHVR